MASKYWETETPITLTTEKNEVRAYNEAGKIQVYPRISSGRGIGRGATIDLEGCTVDDLKKIKELINIAIDLKLGGDK